MNHASISQSWIRSAAQDFGGFCLLATASLVVGLVLNQFRDKPLPWVYQSKSERLDSAVVAFKSEPSATVASPTSAATLQLPPTLTLEEFKTYVNEKRGLILDARPEVFHRLGHVPGAQSLPRESFETAYAQMKERLETNKAQPLAVYCSSASCEDAELLKAALTGLGYTNVSVFSGGWAAWGGAGLPEEKNL